jgi:hypothetical protein
VGPIAGGCVIEDLEKMVLEIVLELIPHLEDFDFELWREQWNRAGKVSKIVS